MATDTNKGDPKLNEWGEPVPAPIVPDYLAMKDPGTVITGVVVARDEGDYGPYYLIRLTAPCKVYEFDKDKTGKKTIRDGKPGDVIMISETNALKPIAARMKGNVPVAVRIEILARKENRLEMDLRMKPAF